MTKEFAIDYLLDDCQDCPENKGGECMTQSHCFEVKRMAIDALKQEPFDIDQYCKEHGYILCEKGTEKKVLDDIKAEIEELKPNNPNFKGYYEQNIALNKALEIIDKYMKEGDS